MMRDISKLRCVVFGAGGFIGTNLCRFLVDKVEYVKAFGRTKSFPDALDGIDWLPGDFNDSAAVATAVAGCDTVYHLVTSTTPASSNIDKIRDLETNVISTLHLLDACREEGVKRVIFLSSGGTVYGKTQRVPTPETEICNPINSYGISKLTIERYLHLYEYLYGLEYVSLRVSNPYGPYQTALKNQGVIAAFIVKILNNKPIDIWGDGSVVRDYIYIDDLLSALLKSACYEGKNRILNIGSGEGSNLNEILFSIEEILEKKANVRYLSSRKADAKNSTLDISLARKELSWNPDVDLKKGLIETVCWAKNNYGF